jgi:hypothetical protein
MSLRYLLIIGALESALNACGAPSRPSSAVASVQSAQTHVLGFVRDTAFRPLSGAKIELLDGPHAGESQIADGNGAFEFLSNASGSVTLRAQRDGFESATVGAVWKPLNAFGLAISLRTVEPSLTFTPGPYTLTITNDLATAAGSLFACAGFPAQLATRTYEGSISVGINAQGSYAFYPLPTNPTLNPLSGSFVIGVAGKFVAIQNDGDFNFIEEFPGFRYLMIAPRATASEPATSTGASIVVPVDAEFRYCQLTSGLGNANDCSQVLSQIVESHWCYSTHDTMVFTKR